MALNFTTLLEGYKKKLSEGIQQGLSNARGNLNTLGTNINMVRTNPKFAQQLPQMVGYGIKDLTSEASRSLPKPLQKPMSIAGNLTGNITQGFTGLLSAPFTNQTPYQKLSNVAEGIGQVALPGKTLGFAAIGTGFNALGNMVTQRRLPTLDELGQEFNKQQMESGKTALTYELTGKVLKGPFDKIFGPTLQNANQFINQGARFGGPILQNPYYRAVAKRLLIDVVRSGQELGIPSAILGFIDSDKQNFEDRLVEGLHSYVSGVGQGMAFKTGEQTLKIAPKQFLDRVIKPAIDRYKALTPQQQQGGYLKPNEFFPEYGKSQYKNIAQIDELNRTRNIIMQKLNNLDLPLAEQNQYRRVLGTIEDRIYQLQGDVKTAELAGGGRAKTGEVATAGISNRAAMTGKVGQTGQKLPERVAQATKEAQIPIQQPIKLQAGNVPPGIPSSGGSIPQDPVQKIIQALKEAKPLRGQQEQIYSKIRSKQAGAVAGVGANIPGEAGYHAQLGQLKGSMPKVTFESIRKQIGQTDIDSLFNTVEKSNLSPFERVTAKSGLAKLLGAEGGAVPQQGELKLLNEIFPPEFIQATLDKKPLMEKLWGGTENLLNLPRSIMATADLSAPLRQGVFLIGRPKQWIPAVRDMFKYAFSENAYKGLQKDIATRHTYKLMRESKLAITDMGPILTSREEAFMSNLAEKIPGFGKLARASNRAYSGFLNKLRADTFDDLVKNAQKQGITIEGKTLQDIAKFVNSATGRGDLGALARSSQVLTNVFFSPRLMASRLNLLNPVYYAKLDPFVRKEALKSLFTFAGTAMTVFGLAKMAGAEVGADPRSADFGKIKTGDTRYDILGGFQQYMVLAARLISGQMVSSTTGREFNLGEGYKPTTRLDIIQRFFESKNSPVVSFALGLLKGQTNMGEEFKPGVEIVDRMIPMVAQDMYDLYKEDEVNGIFKALPALFGVGVQTYGDQIPMRNITPTGKITTKWRLPPSLGENLVNKVTGNKVSDIPVEQWPQLRAIKDAETQKKLLQDNAKRMLIETGKIQEGGGQKYELKNGIVTPVGQQEQGLMERILGVKQVGAAEDTGLNSALQQQVDIANAKLEVSQTGETKQIGDSIVIPNPDNVSGVSVISKKVYDRQLSDAQYSYYSDQFKDKGDITNWASITEQYINYLKEQKLELTGKYDEVDRIKLDKKIGDLEQSLSKYQGYGGFTKPKKPKKITIKKVSMRKVTPKTVKKISIPAPRYRKIKGYTITAKTVTKPKIVATKLDKWTPKAETKFTKM